MKKASISKTKKGITLAVIATVVLLLASFFAVLTYQRRSIAFPEEVNFGVWHLPGSSEQYELLKDTITYDNRADILTFVVQVPNNGLLTFTQQAVPESVAGQTDMFDVQLKSLPEVAKFDSVNGPVSITHPTATDEATAIMRSKGTLLLVHSDSQMSIENWRKLFNEMEIKV